MASPNTLKLRSAHITPTITPLGRYTNTAPQFMMNKVVRDFGPGSVIPSRDGRTAYGVAQDGSFRKVQLPKK
jgi:hypothetical protein